MPYIPDDAYVLTPCGPLGSRIALACERVFIGEYDSTEDALDEVCRRMERESFWPSTIWVSDHGNWWFIDPLTGEELPFDEDDLAA